jgi:type I restriction enzyme, S subunit
MPGETPAGWTLKRVHELGHVQLGRQRTPSAATGPFQTSYLRVANVYDGFIKYSNVLKMSFTPAERKIFYLQPGDILLNEGQSLELVGRSAIYNGKPNRYCIQNTLVRFRCSADLLPNFAQPVFHRWMHTGRFAQIAKQTTSIAHLGASRFAEMRIPTPPLPEQRRIAEILDTLDGVIRKTEQVIKKLQQMKQGLLHDLLTRGINEHGELRDPQRHPEQFKDSPLGRIPKDWEVGPFATYASPTRPFLKTGPFGSSLKGEHWIEEGVPVITIGALGEGCFTESELLFISEQKAKELAAYSVEPGDIVFSRVADVGRSVVVEEPQRSWVMSSNLMWISLDQTRIEPAFVWLNLSGNPSVRNQVRRSVNAGGREVANGGILRSLRLPWPNKPEQSRIKAAAKAWQARVEDEARQLAKLRTLKQGLMDDLLTGRVRVNVEEAAP